MEDTTDIVPEVTLDDFKDGRGGKREGAGRKEGSVTKYPHAVSLSVLRRGWRATYAEETMTELHALIVQKKTPG